MWYANTSMKPLAKIVKIENLNIQSFVKKNLQWNVIFCNSNLEYDNLKGDLKGQMKGQRLSWFKIGCAYEVISLMLSFNIQRMKVVNEWYSMLTILISL